MTGQQIIDLLRFNIHDEHKKLISDTQALLLLNRTALQIQNILTSYSFKFDATYEDVSVVSDTNDYTLAATRILNFYLIERIVSGQNNVNIEGTIIPQEYKNRYGRHWREPVIYFTGATTFSFRRTPTDNYTLRLHYNRHSSTSIGLTDSITTIPEQYQDLIPTRMAFTVMKSHQETRARQWEEEFARQLLELEQSQGLNKTQTSIHEVDDYA